MNAITIKELKEAVKKLEARAKHWPEGYLTIRTKPYMQYFNVVNGKANYISRDNKDLIKCLCQKKYERQMLKIANENLARLKKNKELIKMDKPFTNMDAERRKFVTPLFISDNDYKIQWQNQKVEKSTQQNNNDFYTTRRGEHVRSKSEIIIANLLDELGYAYFYEKPLEINGYTINPDFTILNTKTRKEIIWEHFGMMSDESYRLKAWHKIHSYLQEGYAIGKNLIITFEETNYPLQTNDLAKMLKLYFD